MFLLLFRFKQTFPIHKYKNKIEKRPFAFLGPYVFYPPPGLLFYK